jgi:hypothetical protein
MKLAFRKQRESGPPMRNITKPIVLLRARLELPAGLEFKTDIFREGWNFVRSRGVARLEKKIRLFGWHCVRTADELPICGVGETSQKAIASALQLVLGRTGQYFNGVEVARIHVTTYPWFVLAGVGVHLFRIQQSPVQFVPDDALPQWLSAPKTRLKLTAPWPSPEPGCAIHLLEQPSPEFQSLRTTPQ